MFGVRENAFYVESSRTSGQNGGNSFLFDLIGLKPIAIGTLEVPVFQPECAIAIGPYAGLWDQGECAIAMGKRAGQTFQGIEAVAIGVDAGAQDQGNFSVALGPRAGKNTQHHCTIVFNATCQSLDTQQPESWYVNPIRNATQANLLYYDATDKEITFGPPTGGGNLPPGEFYSDYLFWNDITEEWEVGKKEFHLGSLAGQTNQGSYAVAIGYAAGITNQHPNSIILNASGTYLNSLTQNSFYVEPVRGPVLSSNVLYYNTTNKEITFGPGGGGGSLPPGENYSDYLFWNSNILAWEVGQTEFHLGSFAGLTNQGSYAVAIGYEAGIFNQKQSAIAIGQASGNLSQQARAIAIGVNAGQTQQFGDAIAVGTNAGSNIQGTYSIAIGYQAQNEGSSVVEEYQTFNTEQVGREDNIATIITYTPHGLSDGDNITIYYFTDSSFGNFGDIKTVLSVLSPTSFTYANVGPDEPLTMDIFGAFWDTTVLFTDQVGRNTDIATIITTVPHGLSIGDELTVYTFSDSSFGEYGNIITVLSTPSPTSFTYTNVGPNEPLTSSISGILFIGSLIPVGDSSIAIGSYAGHYKQSAYAIAIGPNSGQTSQSTNAIAIGQNAGNYNQLEEAIAIGADAGRTNQNGIAIGKDAGQINQTGIAIGPGAGRTNQSGVAIGFLAGQNNQGLYAVAIGRAAGADNQEGIAIGYSSGGQGDRSVAIGNNAGQEFQREEAIAIGFGAGYITQGTRALAIGKDAGRLSQQTDAIAIGTTAGYSNQSTNAIAIGVSSGYSSQSNDSIAIGRLAGYFSLPSYSIALGFAAGYNNNGNRSIVFNAAPTQLSAWTQSSWIVNPIRTENTLASETGDTSSLRRGTLGGYSNPGVMRYSATDRNLGVGSTQPCYEIVEDTVNQLVPPAVYTDTVKNITNLRMSLSESSPISGDLDINESAYVYFHAWNSDTPELAIYQRSFTLVGEGLIRPGRWVLAKGTSAVIKYKLNSFIPGSEPALSAADEGDHLIFAVASEILGEFQLGFLSVRASDNTLTTKDGILVYGGGSSAPPVEVWPEWRYIGMIRTKNATASARTAMFNAKNQPYSGDATSSRCWCVNYYNPVERAFSNWFNSAIWPGRPTNLGPRWQLVSTPDPEEPSPWRRPKIEEIYPSDVAYNNDTERARIDFIVAEPNPSATNIQYDIYSSDTVSEVNPIYVNFRMDGIDNYYEGTRPEISGNNKTTAGFAQFNWTSGTYVPQNTGPQGVGNTFPKLGQHLIDYVYIAGTNDNRINEHDGHGILARLLI